MPPTQFHTISQGMFDSKLLYCLQLFGNTWLRNQNDDTQRRFKAFTKADNQKLQVLQNKVLRMKTNLPFGTPTVTLTRTANKLSVHQLTAYTTLLTIQKTLVRGQPHYFREKLLPRHQGGNNDELDSVAPRRQENSLKINSNLTISRGGFFYRGAALFNKLPLSLRLTKSESQFKREIKQWVQQNVDVKPG